MPFLKIYTASKTTHAKRWMELHEKSRTIQVTARWIKQVILDDGDIIENGQTRNFAARCWVEDFEDIKSSDYLLLYAEPGEHLRGGLVEAGYALANGVPVVCLGNHPDYGSWQWHPLVIHINGDVNIFESWCEQELATRMKALPR